MGVRVARGPRVEALPRRLVGDRLLGVSRHGVVLGVGSQHRTAGAVGGDEGGGHFAGPPIHLEAVGLQQVAEGLGGAVFPPGGFGVVPDPAVEVGKGLVDFVQPIGGRVVFWGRWLPWGDLLWGGGEFCAFRPRGWVERATTRVAPTGDVGNDVGGGMGMGSRLRGNNDWGWCFVAFGMAFGGRGRAVPEPPLRVVSNIGLTHRGGPFPQEWRNLGMGRCGGKG